MKKLLWIFPILILASISLAQETRLRAYQVKVDTNNLGTITHSSTSTVQDVIEWVDDNLTSSAVSTSDVQGIIYDYNVASNIVDLATLQAQIAALQVIVSNEVYVKDVVKGTGDGTVSKVGNTVTVNFSAGGGGTVVTGNVTVGIIAMWPTENVPSGWLECNGAYIGQATYTNLYDVLAQSYGPITTNSGTGLNEFKLPDFRGYFVRAWDHGIGRDPNKTTRTDRGDGTIGDYPGTLQNDEYESHQHSYDYPEISARAIKNGTGLTIGCSLVSANDGNTDASGGSETRPININAMYIIKY